MSDLLVHRATAVLLVLWGGLFVYQLLSALALIRFRGDPGPEHAGYLATRVAMSLLLLLLLIAAFVYVWRGAVPAAATPGAVGWGRLAVAVAAAWGVWWQGRQWSGVLGLSVKGTFLLPAAFWVAVVAALAGFVVLRGVPPFVGDAVRSGRAWLAAAAGNAAVRWAAASAVAAILLVYMGRIDERLRWLMGELRWARPRLTRRIAAVFLAAGLAVGSLFVALLIVLGRNVMLYRRGQPMLPDFLPGFPPVYFDLALGCVPLAMAAVLFRAVRRPMYDVFLSYKSEDVALVRRVADLLTAAGVRVWFAEYEVRLRRRRFEAALRKGLRQSAWGVAFTNNRYVDSPWCRREIEVLLRRRGAGRVLEVQLPREDQPRRRYPALSSSPALESRDAAEILAFVGSHTGFEGRTEVDMSSGATARYEGRYLGRPLTLDTTGWVVHQSAQDGEIGGLTFRLQDERRVFVNLWAHPEESDAGRRAEQTVDDRRMFDFLARFARGHLRRLPVPGVQAAGVHLFFHSGLSQIALTYPMGQYWTRKVSLVIPNRETGRVAEFEFTFGFLGSFAEYCRHAALMDRLAQSLAWT